MQEIDAQEFAHLLSTHPDSVLVDVRFDYERAEHGRIAGAQEIPLYLPDWELNPEFVARVTQVMRPGQPLVFICRSGHRSCEACEQIKDIAPEGVYSLREGHLGLIKVFPTSICASGQS